MSEKKKFSKPLFDVRKWMGLDSLEEGGRFIRDSARHLLTVGKAGRKETFEEAMRRLNLTELDIAKQQQRFLNLCLLFMMAAIGLLGYAFYLMLFAKSYAASLAAFGLTAFLLGQTFRYHFWWFQIKNRKLGCSFKEWLQRGII